MKKILSLIVVSLLLSGNAYAEKINMFCLVNFLHLQKAKIDEKEYKRFIGKVIKFEINMEESLVFDVSEQDELNVISGIYRGFSEFTKTGAGINYKTEEELRGDQGKTIKYSYNNTISIGADNRSGSLTSRIKQTGLSLKKFNFFIPCRWYDYNDNEKLLASAGGIYGKKESGRVEATENVLNMIDQMKGGKKTDQMKCGKGSTESCTVKPKVESKITVNENEILNLEAYVPFSPDALLTMYKAKFFNNDITNYVFLKNRNYLKFEPGQQLTFKDIKELNEKRFFALPLHNSKDRDRLKILKKEYLSKKKAIKKVG
jgi:hypothetical protein